MVKKNLLDKMNMKTCSACIATEPNMVSRSDGTLPGNLVIYIFCSCLVTHGNLVTCNYLQLLGYLGTSEPGNLHFSAVTWEPGNLQFPAVAWLPGNLHFSSVAWLPGNLMDSQH